MIKYLTEFLNLQMYKPALVNIDLTYSCPLHCVSCRRGSAREYENELKYKDYITIFQELRDWNISNVIICGGEPFMRKDIFKIIHESRINNIYPHLVTNGYLLNNHKIRILKKLGINLMSISLNSSNQRIHDATRGIKGSYKKIISTIKELRKSNIKIILFTLMLKQNLDTIPNLIHWAKKNYLNIKLQMFVSPDLMFYAKDSYDAQKNENITYDNLWFKHNNNWIFNDKKIKKVFNQIIDMKLHGYPILNPVWQLRYFEQYYRNPLVPLPFRCELGNTNLSIDPYGNVRLCYAMSRLGNVTKEKLKKIWNSKEAHHLRKKIERCKLNCKLMQCGY